MNGGPNTVGQAFSSVATSLSLVTGTSGVGGEESLPACVCNGQNISAVHAYLNRNFRGRSVRDLHAPPKLMPVGVLARNSDYHVVTLVAACPAHAVLLKDFLAHSLAEVEEHLWQWDLAYALRTHRIVIVGEDGVFAP